MPEWIAWPGAGTSAAGHRGAVERLQWLHRLGEAAAYNRQKQRLDVDDAVSAEDLFVASVMRRPAPTGDELVTTWGEGIATLLPRADRVLLVTEDELARRDHGYASAPWARVIEELGLPQTRHRPPRWWTSAFPSRRRLEALAGE